jgi:eukaryotic-like serine/threonine-protein kinase
LVQTCLAKDPDERFQTIHDVKLRLQEIAEARNEENGAADSSPSSRTALVWFTAAAVLLFALAVIMVFSFLKKTPPTEITTFQVDLGSLQVVLQTTGARIAISPDGRTIIFTLHGDTVRPQLFARRLDGLDITPIPGTEGATQPFFSPDSRWVAFSASGKLKKVLLAGGVPVTICQATDTNGVSGTWGEDGNIVFDSIAGPLQMVSAEGGTPHKLEVGNDAYRWPRYLPGARALLAVTRREGRFDIDLIHLDSHKTENLVRDGSWPRYLSSGRIVYSQYNSGGDSSGFTGGLLALPFDLKSLKRSGAPEPALQQVGVGTGGAGFFDVSANGTIVYTPGGPEVLQTMDLVWVDATGKPTPIGVQPHHFHSLKLSPDGKLLAFELAETLDIYTTDLARTTVQRLTFDKHSAVPVFTPDSKRIFYMTGAPGNQEIWSKAADGSGEAALFLRSAFRPTPASISPDGNTLAYSESHPASSSDIYFASLHGDPAPHPFLNTAASEGDAVFSPDGKFIAYVSNETNDRQVYVRRAQGGGGVWLISNTEARYPRWSIDGKKLYFVTEGSKLMVSDVSSSGSTFTAGTPRMIFESADFAHAGYDIARDGRILCARPSASAQKLNILRVIENFDAEIAGKAAMQQP